MPCSYLGYVDLYGTSFSENYAASGYGNYLALPLIRDRWVGASLKCSGSGERGGDADQRAV